MSSPVPPRRLLQESKQAEDTLDRIGNIFWDSDGIDSVLIAPSLENIYIWRGCIKGPSDSPFQGGWFMVRVEVPSEYPLLPPSMWFETKIAHPNIHLETGEVCLDVLKTQWSPAWTLESALRAVQVMLAHPDASSPLNCDCGNLIRSGDTRGYHSIASLITREHAFMKEHCIPFFSRK